MKMNLFDTYRIMDSYIQLRNADPFALQDIPAVTDADEIKSISKLLLNAWSAEYALRITPVVNDEKYLQSALRWTFPQAYFSVLFSARAFLAARGVHASNEEVVATRIGALVAGFYYPESLYYYAYGFGPVMKVRHLFAGVPLLADALKQTRTVRINKAIDALQLNPKTALRDPKKDEILLHPDVEHLSSSQFRTLIGSVGKTTFFDLMKRLRITQGEKSELDILVSDALDVRAFHACLTNIVAHINSVHECYIAKAIGHDAYVDLVRKLPSYLQEGFVRDRMHTRVLPQLKSDLPQLYFQIPV